MEEYCVRKQLYCYKQRKDLQRSGNAEGHIIILGYQ
jgi:hypothetical protein